MRNEKNWSPRKIWLNGMVNPNNAGQTAVRDHEINPDVFGIDDDGPFSLELDPDEEAVVVPDTLSPLTEEQLTEFVDQIDP